MTSEDIKRTSQTAPTEDVQSGNQSWWTDNTMSYDWNDQVAKERFSKPWFDEIDARFIHGARLFGHDRKPFDKIIPFESLNGKRVLEIGCGMGLHSELLTLAGAELTSVDISPTSVASTQKRLALKNLPADIRQMDARYLDFPDNSFDFVWSWGVIHHSAQTAVIMREIARVLKPGGEVRFMVYHLDSMASYTVFLRDHLLGFWRGKTVDECLWKRSDGYMARHYSKDMMRDIMSLFFDDIRTETYGQDADAIPLPRQLRYPVMKLFKPETIARWANERGAFLFTLARKPATIPAS
jgi:2-polyprenyl-3-methyl-5-hydroxy-6-metoxy-1,4-benzoquinol methylase